MGYGCRSPRVLGFRARILQGYLGSIESRVQGLGGSSRAYFGIQVSGLRILYLQHYNKGCPASVSNQKNPQVTKTEMTKSWI